MISIYIHWLEPPPWPSCWLEAMLGVWSEWLDNVSYQDQTMVGDPLVSVYTPDIPCTGSWSLYSRYSLYGVGEFILPIFPVRGRGVYTPDIPCTGSWSLYSRYSLYGVVEFILPIFPVRDCGIYTDNLYWYFLYGIVKFAPWLTRKRCWTSAFLLNVYWLRGDWAVLWLLADWDQQPRKAPLKYSGTPGDWTHGVERTDNEIHPFSH